MPMVVMGINNFKIEVAPRLDLILRPNPARGFHFAGLKKKSKKNNNDGGIDFATDENETDSEPGGGHKQHQATHGTEKKQK